MPRRNVESVQQRNIQFDSESVNLTYEHDKVSELYTPHALKLGWEAPPSTEPLSVV